MIVKADPGIAGSVVEPWTWAWAVVSVHCTVAVVAAAVGLAVDTVEWVREIHYCTDTVAARVMEADVRQRVSWVGRFLRCHQRLSGCCCKSCCKKSVG